MKTETMIIAAAVAVAAYVVFRRMPSAKSPFPAGAEPQNSYYPPTGASAGTYSPPLPSPAIEIDPEPLDPNAAPLPYLPRSLATSAWLVQFRS